MSWLTFRPVVTLLQGSGVSLPPRRTLNLVDYGVVNDPTFNRTTITGPVADNLALAGQATGDMFYYDGAHWVVLAPGSSGQLLITNGAGANPSWATKGAVPTISSISPDHVVSPAAAQLVTITGTGYLSTSSAQLVGVNQTTTFVNGTTLQFTVPVGDTGANPATYAVNVFTPHPGGGTSNTSNFEVRYASPTAASLSVSTSLSGQGGVTSRITGTGYYSTGTVAKINGVSATTRYVDATHVDFDIPAASTVTPGTLSITVFNPTPGGGTSGALTFTVAQGPPILTSISPTTATQFDGQTALTPTGSQFTSLCTIYAGATALVTTFTNSTTISAVLPKAGATNSQFEIPGTVAITVQQTSGTSAAQTLTINRFANEKLWLRCDLGFTLNSGNVSALNDLSGSGDSNKNVVQATALKQPPYTATNATYNNTATIANATASATGLVSGTWASPISLSSVTVYFVGNSSGLGNKYAWASNDAAPLYGLFENTPGGGWTTFRSQSAVGSTSAHNPCVVCSVFDASVGAQYVNAITTADGVHNFTASSIANFRVGSYLGELLCLGGSWAEIIVFSAAHNSTQRGLIMNYLAARYAITVAP